jgi:GntR family transcriptional regulator
VGREYESANKYLTSWKRLYRRKGEPFAVAWVYLGAQITGVTRDLAACQTSYQIIEKIYKSKIDHADISIRAQASNLQTRKLLQMPPGTPVIALERVSFLADGTPVEYALYCAHADAYEYTFRVSSKVNAASALSRRTG